MGKLYLYGGTDPRKDVDTGFAGKETSWVFNVKPAAWRRQDDFREFCAKVRPTGGGASEHPDVPAGKVGVFEFVGLVDEDGKEPHGAGEVWFSADKDGFTRPSKSKPKTHPNGIIWMREMEPRGELPCVKRGTAVRFRLVPVETLELGYDIPKPKPAPTIEEMRKRIIAASDPNNAGAANRWNPGQCFIATENSIDHSYTLFTPVFASGKEGDYGCIQPRWSDTGAPELYEIHIGNCAPGNGKGASPVDIDTVRKLVSSLSNKQVAEIYAAIQW